jgi:hypothetical protein
MCRSIETSYSPLLSRSLWKNLVLRERKKEEQQKHIIVIKLLFLQC